MSNRSALPSFLFVHLSTALIVARVALLSCSISTVYKAQCLETQETVIIKIYERAKMKAKHEQRLQREIRLMRQLQGSEGKQIRLRCSTYRCRNAEQLSQ